MVRMSSVVASARTARESRERSWRPCAAREVIAAGQAACLYSLMSQVVTRLDMPKHQSCTRSLGRWDARGDPLCGVRAIGEAARAVQGVFEECLRRQRRSDPAIQFRDSLAKQVGMPHRVGRGHQHREVPQAETDLLAHQDHRHPIQVGRAVAPLAGRVPGGRQQTDAFPVPQHMGGQPEPPGQLADGQLIA